MASLAHCEINWFSNMKMSATPKTLTSRWFWNMWGYLGLYNLFPAFPPRHSNALGANINTRETPHFPSLWVQFTQRRLMNIFHIHFCSHLWVELTERHWMDTSVCVYILCLRCALRCAYIPCETTYMAALPYITKLCSGSDSIVLADFRLFTSSGHKREWHCLPIIVVYFDFPCLAVFMLQYQKSVHVSLKLTFREM